MNRVPDGPHAGRYRGWEVVAGCFVMATVAWGLGFYGNGIYLAGLVGERGLPLEFVSAGITAYYWIGAVMIMTCGGLIDRLGPRRSVALGSVSMVLAVAVIARVEALWQFYAALALMAVGWTTMSSSAINAILAPWFERKRGVALSLALTGASFGGIAVVPLLEAATRGLGMRDGLTFSALALGAIVLAVSARSFVRSPDLVGQAVDGVRSPGTTPSGATTTQSTGTAGATPAAAGAGFGAMAGARDAPWTLRRVLASRPFLTNTGPFSAGLTIQVGVLTHQISMLQPSLGREGAAWAVSLTTLSAVLGRVVAGAVMDRLSRRAIAALNFGVQGLGLLMLAWAADPIGLFAGCVLCGLAVGNMITFPGLLIHHEFPSAQFNRVNRLAVGVGQAFYACGPTLMSVSVLASGGYSMPLLACAGMAGVAGVVVWLGRPRGGRA